MAKDNSLTNMRAHYRYGELLEGDVHPDPVAQFNRWMNEAVLDNLFEPNALSLATVGADGQPSCRTVLLKAVLEEGFVFYTNYNSRKASQIRENEKAAMLFWWREQERQVRIEGTIQRVPREMSVDYFDERPFGSRIGAIASPQSSIIKDREELDALYAGTLQKVGEGKPECPEDWGGFILAPHRFEFWQGRPNRMHDRLEYRRETGGSGEPWTIVRLAP